MTFIPEVEDWSELQDLLQTRAELVGELSEAAQARPTDESKAMLERSLFAGSELTRKLARYRMRLESELSRINHLRPLAESDAAD